MKELSFRERILDDQPEDIQLSSLKIYSYFKNYKNSSEKIQEFIKQQQQKILIICKRFENNLIKLNEFENKCQEKVKEHFKQFHKELKEAEEKIKESFNIQLQPYQQFIKQQSEFFRSVYEKIMNEIALTFQIKQNTIPNHVNNVLEKLYQLQKIYKMIEQNGEQQLEAQLRYVFIPPLTTPHPKLQALIKKRTDILGQIDYSDSFLNQTLECQFTTEKLPQIKFPQNSTEKLIKKIKKHANQINFPLINVIEENKKKEVIIVQEQNDVEEIRQPLENSCTIFSNLTESTKIVNKQIKSEIPDEIKNKMCFFGNANKLLILDAITNTWEKITLNIQFTKDIEFNKEKQSLFKNFSTCIFIKGLLILVGGGPSNDAYIMRFKSKQELEIIANLQLNQRRCWHACVQIQNYVYVIGGFDGSKSLKQCEKIWINEATPNEMRFTNIASLNQERQQFGCVGIQQLQRIYVMGGIISQNVFMTSSFEYYSIEQNQWIQQSLHLPKKLCGLSLVYKSNSNSIFIFGGRNNKNQLVNQVLEYQIDKQQFKTQLQQLIEPRQLNNKAFKYNDDAIYLVGGNYHYNFEIYSLNEYKSISQPNFSYEYFCKNDLNNYSQFQTF